MSTDARVAAELNQFPDKDGFRNKGSKKLILNYYLNFVRLKKNSSELTCVSLYTQKTTADVMTSQHIFTQVFPQSYASVYDNRERIRWI